MDDMEDGEVNRRVLQTWDREFPPLDHWVYTCPMCKTEWIETRRKRASCPGCGAGWEEMGRVSIRQRNPECKD